MHSNEFGDFVVVDFFQWIFQYICRFRGSAALRTLVTWVVLIASRDGFCNPLKPNTQDYTNTIIVDVVVLKTIIDR
jgi:hypothetical protein